MGLFRKKDLILISTGLTACMIFSSCSVVQKEKKKIAPIAMESTVLSFDYLTVDKGDVLLTESVMLNYSDKLVESLYFKADDVVITKQYVEVGDEVKKGDLLLESSASGSSLEVERYEKDIADYQSKYDYYEALKKIEEDRKVICENYNLSFDSTNLDNYKTQADTNYKSLKLAKSQLQEEKDKLEGSSISATMDGTIGFIAKTDLANRLGKYDSAITIVQNNQTFSASTKSGDYFELDGVYEIQYGYNVYEEAEVSEFDKKYGWGHHTDVTVNYGSVMAKCINKTVVNEANGTYKIDLAPETPLDVDITSANLIFTVDSAKDVIRIASDAVFKSGDGYAVYTEDKDGGRSVHSVSIGLMGDDYVEIVSGLSVGDTVVMKAKEEKEEK